MTLKHYFKKISEHAHRYSAVFIDSGLQLMVYKYIENTR